MRPDLLSFRAAAIAVLVFTAGELNASAEPILVEGTEDHRIAVEVVASGFEHPWGMAFLPDGRILVTERAGRLRLVSNGSVSAPLDGLPEIDVVGQGGLLDVALHPEFSENSLVYLSHSAPGRGGGGTAITRARLETDGGNPRLSSSETIFSMNNKTRGSRHFGSRLAFADDGTLFFTIGDRGERPRAQDASDHAGSVLRIHDDGSIPDDNPDSLGADAAPEIWSIGHRNPQSAAIHPETRKLWVVEHGARGGDEINVPEKGKNYGWPVISYGVHYAGGQIGVGTEAPGMEQPVHYWDPSIAPSGMAFYTGSLFPRWQGDLFVGALRDRHLERLKLDGERVVHSERLLGGLNARIRDVRNGPDGALYVLTDAPDGALLRIAPAE